VKISGSPTAQADFQRAVALLHSFWYEEAITAFTAITTAEPTCAMGYRGLAMSVYHPLWAPPSAAMLAKGSAAIEKGRWLSATPREKDDIAALATFYTDTDKLDHRARAAACEKAMAQVHTRHPSDREAAVFYALALDATAAPTDKTYANQKKAAAILEKVYNGLLGAAPAAELSGDAAKARTLYRRAVALCDRSDGERPELRHAKAVLRSRRMRAPAGRPAPSPTGPISARHTFSSAPQATRSP
jgi:hypothetical protein